MISPCMMMIKPEFDLRSESVIFHYQRQPCGLYKAIAFKSPQTGEWIPVGVDMPMITEMELARTGNKLQESADDHVDEMLRDIDRGWRHRQQIKRGREFVKNGRNSFP